MLDSAQMALDDVARELANLRTEMAGVRSDVVGVKTELAGVKSGVAGVKSELAVMKTEMTEGFTRVDEQLNAAKVRDEHLHDLMKFGLEAREALRESIEDRFDRTERKHDEQIRLLGDVVKTISRR